MTGHRNRVRSFAPAPTAGTVASASTTRCFGWIYPELGVLVFSGAELSRSFQGGGIVLNTDNRAVVYGSASMSGFGAKNSADTEEYNHIRFLNCLGVDNSSITPANGGAAMSVGSANGAGYINMRNAEIQQSTSYFVRLKAPYMNFTTNPTFISGSQNIIRNKSMRGNPQVYVTTVGLYNQNFHCVAVARLSKPVLKNFGSEVTLKVEMTY